MKLNTSIKMPVDKPLAWLHPVYGSRLPAEIPRDGLVVGIDPGLYGAIAVLEFTGRNLCVGMFDMPVQDKVVKGRKRLEVARHELARVINMLKRLSVICWVIEQQLALPMQDVKSTASTFEDFGFLQGLIGDEGTSADLVRPQTWQSPWLVGKQLCQEVKGVAPGKVASIAAAQMHYPDVSLTINGYYRDGRSDALGIADWALRKQKMEDRITDV